MTEHLTSRTLVKSHPELWAQCSDAASLARHLDRFGEIRITRLEPETAVAWEGEHASGTVRLEPSGWGTRVTMTAVPGRSTAREPASAPASAQAADFAQAAEPRWAGTEVSGSRRRWLAGLLAQLWRPYRAAEPSAADPVCDAVTVRARAPVSVPGLAAEPELVPVSAAEPELVPVPAAGPELEVEPELAALTAALDSLGKAHHRPFSRP